MHATERMTERRRSGRAKGSVSVRLSCSRSSTLSHRFPLLSSISLLPCRPAPFLSFLRVSSRFFVRDATMCVVRRGSRQSRLANNTPPALSALLTFSLLLSILFHPCRRPPHHLLLLPDADEGKG